MKHTAILAFLVLLGGCSSTTVYKTTLTETSNVDEDMRTEDIAFCLKASKGAEKEAAIDLIAIAEEAVAFQKESAKRELMKGNLYTGSLLGAADALKILTNDDENDDEASTSQMETQKRFRACLLEKGYTLDTETIKRN